MSPLDDVSARLLAEKYSANYGLYGYLMGLTALEAAHYREVFTFADKVHTLDRQKSIIASGLFQSVLYLLSAAERTGRIPASKNAHLLMDYAKAMNQGPLPSQWTRASLDFLSSYLDASGIGRDSPSLRDVLTPAVSDESITLDDAHTTNPREALCSSYDRVLELQRVPRLDDLLKIHNALVILTSANSEPHVAVNTLADISKTFQDFKVPRNVELGNSNMELLKASQFSRFAALNVQLQKEVASKKVDPKHLQELAGDYWDLLAFRVVMAFAGQIYAVNFRPDDLLIAEDPLFLRKQQFVTKEGSDYRYFASAELKVSSEAGGSRVVGGFDGISSVAGRVAARGLHDGDDNSSFVASELLGSIRATDWSRINQASLRGVMVRIHAAQDWLVLAATQPDLYDAVSSTTQGLISLTRRARLLLALRNRDWEAVWSSLSLTDLFFLAGRLRDRKSQDIGRSPAIEEYQASEASLPTGVDVLGPTLHYLRQAPAPRMVEIGPYENAVVAENPIYLAERLAEFKIYIVRLFAEQGFSAAALPLVAEASARAVLGDVRMTSHTDWSAVLDAYEKFDVNRLKEVIASL